MDSREYKIETIDLAVLKEVFAKFIDHLMVDENVREIEFTKDYYWVFDSKSIYEVSKQPVTESIGSLIEDWKSLKELRNIDRDQIAPFLLKNLGAILYYIGEQEHSKSKRP